VEKIEVENHRAVSVSYRLRGQSLNVRANREILVCTGAIKSPQLLMLSGIGPQSELTKHAIKPVHIMPGVGQNLQDHLKIHCTFACTQPITYDKVDRPWNKLAIGARWLFNQTGFAASNIWEAGGLIAGNEAVEYPNLQYHFAPIGATYEGRKIHLSQAFTVQADQLRPFSRGQVCLNSANPADKPAAYFNYLGDSRDLQELVEGYRKIRELVEQPAFDPYRGKEIDPPANPRNDADVANWVRAISSSDFHPSCSCRMGNDDNAVVDSELKVHGLTGLRVVDASVMPEIVSGNLNAPTQMIAARAADNILGKPALTAEKASFHFQ
jgi:choline dehydrogenase